MGRKRMIRDPRNLQRAARGLTPFDQLADSYGGRAGLEQAIENARRQGKNMSEVLEDLAPDLRQQFPPVDYDRYFQEMDVMPSHMLEGTNEGTLMRPQDKTGPDGMPLDMSSNPSIYADPEMYDIAEWAESSGLNPDGAEAARAARQMGVERPMTEFVLGDEPRQPFGFGDDSMTQMLGEGVDDPRKMNLAQDGGMITAPEVDQTLAAIRRADGNPDLDLEGANRLIEEASRRGLQSLEGSRPVSSQGMDVDAQTGTLIEQLLALNYLPPRAKAALGSRMLELLGVGGVAAGMNMDEQQGIDPRSTMGPLDGLLQ
jgi:hypothetical protein